MNKQTKLEALEELRKSISTGKYIGLCEAAACKVYGEKYSYLTILIKANPTFRGRFLLASYYWKPYKVKPRIKWIDKRIKELSDD